MKNKKQEDDSCKIVHRRSNTDVVNSLLDCAKGYIRTTTIERTYGPRPAMYTGTSESKHGCLEVRERSLNNIKEVDNCLEVITEKTNVLPGTHFQGDALRLCCSRTKNILK